MKNAMAILFFFLLTGCMHVEYVVKIPRTPENLQGYRECQRTVATATGYDAEGYRDLMRRCLATLSGVQMSGELSDEVAIKKAQPKASEGCQQIEFLPYGYNEIIYRYFLCEVLGSP